MPTYPVTSWLGLWHEPPTEDGVVRVRFTPRPDRHTGAPGFLHGGVAATALDEVMGVLGFVLEKRPSVTATLTVQFRTPVPIDGSEVTVEAWRESPPGDDRHRPWHRVRGRLLLADGTVAVDAKGVFVDAPGEMAEGM